MQMKNMSVTVIGCVGVPNSYGGFEALAENLAKTTNLKLKIYCSGKAYPAHERHSSFHGAELVYIPISANGVSSLFYDVISIIHAIFHGERIFLCLGVSGSWIFPFLRLIFPKIKIITNVDGIEWRREKFGKISQFLLKKLHVLAERFSHQIICDNPGLYKFIDFQNQHKVSVIAYGGDQVFRYSHVPSEVKFFNYSLALCRIVPENNIEMIISAFIETNETLVFVGNWCHSEYSKHIYEKYKRHKNLHLLEESYDGPFLYHLRKQAKNYVHGHSAGGTNPSLVEAMFLSDIIFSYDCVFNRHTMHETGYYFKNSQDLAQLLTRKIKSETSIYSKIAHQEYCWDTIADQYKRCCLEKTI
jgi:glycosyltransferase involved in cell wall biosynthesis